MEGNPVNAMGRAFTKQETGIYSKEYRVKKINIITILVFVGMLEIFKHLDRFMKWSAQTEERTTLLWIQMGSYFIFVGLIFIFQYLLVFKQGNEKKAILYIFLGWSLLILFARTPLISFWFYLPSDSFPRTLVFFPKGSSLRHLFFSPISSPMMVQAGIFALLTSIFCLLSKKNCVSNK